MEVLFVIGILAAVTIAAAAADRGRKGLPVPGLEGWQRLAEACGLTEVRAVHRSLSGLVGRWEGLEVSFERNEYDDGQPGGMRLTVQGFSRRVSFKNEGVGTRIERVLGASEIEIGDAAFDRAFFIEGNEGVLRAVLDGETRTLLMDAFAGRVLFSGTYGAAKTLSMVDGVLRAYFTDVTAGPPGPEAVRPLLGLARRLKEPADLMARVLENARRDPLPSVRRAILRMLESQAREHPASRAAIEQAARSDPDGAVRLQAALWLERDGWPMLAELATDGTVEDAVSARAVSELGEYLPLEQARLILEASLTTRRDRTAAAVAVLLGRGGEAEVAPLSAALLRGPLDVAVPAARALGRIGSESAEGPLIECVQRQTDALRVAACEALAFVGTAESVPFLRVFETSLSNGLRKASRESLAQIRGRLGGVGTGRLALSETPDGQVSLADEEQGRVTLPEPPDPS